MKITVTIPDELLADLDQAVAKTYLNRSQYVCRVLERDLRPVDNLSPDPPRPSVSHLRDGQQPSASHPPAVCQPSTSRLPAVSDRSIDREIEGKGCSKNEHMPSPPLPGRKESESMVPAEVEALKREYLHEGPDLVNGALELIARHNGAPLGPGYEKSLLLEWREKSMPRRLQAFRSLLKNQATVKSPEDWLRETLEKGPRKRRRINGVSKAQTSLGLKSDEPPEWCELREKYFYAPRDDNFAPANIRGEPDWQSARKFRPEGMRVPKPPDPCCSYKGYRP